MPLNGSQVLGVRFTFSGVLDDIERYALSVVEGCHAGPLDGADMNENVFGPVFRADETEAFLYIEEFHCPDCHGRPPGSYRDTRPLTSPKPLKISRYGWEGGDHELFGEWQSPAKRTRRQTRRARKR